MEVVADVAFEQAVFGATVPVTLRLPQRCADCGGTGAGAGTQPVMCSDCGGTGQVQRVRQSLLGQMVTAGPCPRCSGLGQIVVTPCPTCRGDGRVTAEHTYQVDVPGGVDTGSTLRLSGRGAAGPRGGAAGDLYVHLRVGEHDRYWRDGNDLVTTVPISIAQAALGTTVPLPTLDGDEELVIPPGTQLEVYRRPVTPDPNGLVVTAPFFWTAAGVPPGGGVEYRLLKGGKVVQQGHLRSKFRVVSIFWPPFAAIYWPMGLNPNITYDLVKGKQE